MLEKLFENVKSHSRCKEEEEVLNLNCKRYIYTELEYILIENKDITINQLFDEVTTLISLNEEIMNYLRSTDEVEFGAFAQLYVFQVLAIKQALDERKLLRKRLNLD